MLNKSLHLTTWRNSHHVPLVLRQNWRCTRIPRQCLVFGRGTFSVVTSTPRMSFGVSHCLNTVFKDHYTPWSALLGLPSSNMTSLDHSGSRKTMSSLWRSTPSDISRCFVNSGQHLVDEEGSSGSTSGSGRMVPPLTFQTYHWHGYSSVSLTDWLASGVTRNGRAFTVLEPPDFYLWRCLKDKVYVNNSQAIPDLNAAITAIEREECVRGSVKQSMPVTAGSSFWSSVKQTFERRTGLEPPSCLLQYIDFTECIWIFMPI